MTMTTITTITTRKKEVELRTMKLIIKDYDDLNLELYSE
jgi:hypothetical protein